jgi:1-acyl-sn-glycerol-3-phosphate acyltransferase
MWAMAIAALTVLALLIAWWRSGRTAIDFFGMGFLHMYVRLWHRYAGRRPTTVPPSGPVLLVANHSSSSDPTLISHGSPRLPGYMIAKEYYDIGLARPLLAYQRCVPTTRNGNDVAATRQALRQLSEGGVIAIFPEGNLSQAGRRGLRRGKPGAAYLALKSRASVVPVHIRGGPMTSKVVPAWLLPSRKGAKVTFGPPVNLAPYYDRPIDRQLLEEVTDLLMRRIEDLDPRR